MARLTCAMRTPRLWRWSGVSMLLALFAFSAAAVGLPAEGDCYLHSEAGPHGAVDGPADGWYAAGTEITLKAVADDGHVFARWEGDVPAESRNDNPLMLTLDRTRAVRAVFAASPACGSISGRVRCSGDQENVMVVATSVGTGREYCVRVPPPASDPGGELVAGADRSYAIEGIPLSVLGGMPATADDVPLLPGQSFWVINNQEEPQKLTLAGVVPTEASEIATMAGLNALAYPFPTDCRWDATGLATQSVAGSVLKLWDSAVRGFREYTMTSAGWSPDIGEIPIARGFLYQSQKAGIWFEECPYLGGLDAPSPPPGARDDVYEVLVSDSMGGEFVSLESSAMPKAGDNETMFYYMALGDEVGSRNIVGYVTLSISAHGRELVGQVFLGLDESVMTLGETFQGQMTAGDSPDTADQVALFDPERREFVHYWKHTSGHWYAVNDGRYEVMAFNDANGNGRADGNEAQCMYAANPVCVTGDVTGVNMSIVPEETPVHYVSLAGGHEYPFETWAKAATNIQAAVDAACDGDTVLVTNGVYDAGGRIAEGTVYNRVCVTSPVVVRSVNGAEHTTIEGGWAGPSSDLRDFRCAYLSGNAGLSGFTLTRGYTKSRYALQPDPYGGGALCRGGYLSDCVIVECRAGTKGGGVYCDGGGTVESCIISNNTTRWEDRGDGGGVFCGEDGLVRNCLIAENLADSDGGGVCCKDGGVVENCRIVGNECWDRAGGVYCGYGGIVQNCFVSGNEGCDAGGVFVAWGGTLRNSLVIDNPGAGSKEAGVACQGDGLVESCTIVGNAPTGLMTRNGGRVRNSIIYANLDPGGTNWTNYGGVPGDFSYCCTFPLPPGPGNIAGDPQFVDAAAGDYRLLPTSPCINAGTNEAWMVGATDLDGNPRIVGEAVDVGAYECTGDPLPSIVVSPSAITGQVVVAGSTVTREFIIRNVGAAALSYAIMAPDPDSLPEQQWTRYWGSDEYDVALDIAVDGEDAVYVVGGVRGSVDGRDYAGRSDVCLAKFDQEGRRLWTRTWGGNWDDQGHGVAVDGLGCVYVVGSAGSNFVGEEDGGSRGAFVTKLDREGNRLWTRIWESSAYGLGTTVDARDNIYVTLSVSGSLHGQQAFGDQDFCVMKLDGDGQRLWTRVWGSSRRDMAIGIDTDDSGDVYVMGRVVIPRSGLWPGHAEHRFYLSKLDAEGNVLWKQEWDRDGPSEGIGQYIAVDPWNDLYLTGSGSPLMKHDSDGNELWLAPVPSSVHDVCVGPWEDAYVTGGWSSDTVITSVAPDGRRLWSLDLDGPGRTWGTAVAACSRGNVFVAGIAATNSADLSMEQRDMFLAKIRPSQSPRWLTIDPVSGVVPPRSEAVIRLTFDATGFAAGDVAEATLHIGSNDPAEPVVLFPVSMIVSAPPDTAFLTVAGDPGELGISTPYDYGTHELPAGTVVTNHAVARAHGNWRRGHRLVCAGWRGTGDVPASGDAASVAFTIDNDSSLTWLWEHQYRLRTYVVPRRSHRPPGTVDVPGGWFDEGATVTLTATEADGWQFARWCGNVPIANRRDNPLTVVMDRGRRVIALFVRDAWGDYFGWGDDVDGDGMADLSELAAGTDMCDSADALRVRMETGMAAHGLLREAGILASPGASGSGICVLEWPTVTGRLYAVESATNLLDGFVPVATGIVGTGGNRIYTTDDPVLHHRFYRIAVEDTGF